MALQRLWFKMFKNIENIKLIYCRFGKRTSRKIIEERSYHLFSIGVSGSRKLDFGDKVISSGKGSLIFIPKGYSYEYMPTDKEFASVTITFDADISNPTPGVYDISDFADYDKIIKYFPKLWQNKTPSNKHKCFSMFHNLLAYLIDNENIKYSDKRKVNLIEPALKYIDANLADVNLKPGKLPLLCGISPAYFRKLFMSNLGVSPQKYIEEKRLQHAMSILEEANKISISELANCCGYKDQLYFGKVFKKNTAYRRRTIKMFCRCRALNVKVCFWNYN